MVELSLILPAVDDPFAYYGPPGSGRQARPALEASHREAPRATRQDLPKLAVMVESEQEQPFGAHAHHVPGFGGDDARIAQMVQQMASFAATGREGRLNGNADAPDARYDYFAA
jgi:hypothetical protein